MNNKDQINNNQKITKYIQIGNSRDPRNFQEEILECIKNNQDLYLKSKYKIFLPLAYGDIHHLKKIQKLSLSFFKEENIYILSKTISYDKYCNLLNSVEVAIFNHDRQQAIGNILNLLYLGKTVYLRSSVTTWEFLKDHELIARDVQDIKDGKPFLLLSDQEKNKTN